MLIVEVKKGDSIEAALKKIKYKVKKTKLIEQLRDRQCYKKPSIIKRETLEKAKYIQKRKNEEID
jgi:small subunit ribosomal protein S21